MHQLFTCRSCLLNSLVNSNLSTVDLARGIRIRMYVAAAAVDRPYVSDLFHGLFDQGLFDWNQCTGGNRCADLLLCQAVGDGRYHPQKVGLSSQLSVSCGGFTTDMDFHIRAAEFSGGPEQVGKCVGGNLYICSYADESQFAGGGMMECLTIEGVADSSTEMPNPLGQGFGGLHLDSVGFVRRVWCFDVGHAQIVFGKQSLGVGRRQSGFMLVA